MVPVRVDRLCEIDKCFRIPEQGAHLATLGQQLRAEEDEPSEQRGHDRSYKYSEFGFSKVLPIEGDGCNQQTEREADARGGPGAKDSGPTH